MSNEEFFIILENYRNQYIAEGLNPSNSSSLELAKEEINMVLTDLVMEKKRLIEDNAQLRKDIKQMNKIIKKTKKRNHSLEDESTRLDNSELGAVEQNDNIEERYKRHRLKLILKTCLAVVIIIFLYINEDIVQAIRSRVPKKFKRVQEHVPGLPRGVEQR